jgi:hypothetical protein
MASEVKAQELVHTLEHGSGRRWVVLLLIIAFALFQSVAHVLINPMNRLGGQAAIFVGLTHPKGIEQAVISRELARGHGFSTKVIKPAAVALMEKNKGSDGFSSLLKPDGPTGGDIPDLYSPPPGSATRSRCAWTKKGGMISGRCTRANTSIPPIGSSPGSVSFSSSWRCG